MRVNLRVPYEERHEAKRLGAWWDPARKTWFIVNREDLTPFMRWLPIEQAQSKRKEKPAPTIAARSFNLPECSCSSPPWEHCEHTQNAPAKFA